MLLVTMIEAIRATTEGRDLTEEEAAAAMGAIMNGEASPSQITALAIAMKMKGEAVSELVGFAQKMRANAVKVRNSSGPLLDTCGTGGSKCKTMNISTAAALIACAAGVRVAKHGNRGVTRACGSADVLESLGIRLNLSKEQCEKALTEVGFAFLFAPLFHPAMKAAAVPRREIGVRTIFNLLGPLTNPAGAAHQLLGVSDEPLVKKLAEALRRLGTMRSVVVHGVDGLDDVSPIGATVACLVEGDRITELAFSPSDFGIQPVRREDIAAKETAEASAQAAIRAISVPDTPESDAVIPSAAIAIWISGLAESPMAAASLVRQTVASGAAKQKLEQMRNWMRQNEEHAE